MRDRRMQGNVSKQNNDVHQRPVMLKIGWNLRGKDSSEGIRGQMLIKRQQVCKWGKIKNDCIYLSVFCLQLQFVSFDVWQKWIEAFLAHAYTHVYSILKSHRVSSGDDGAFVRCFQRPGLSGAVGKQRLPLAPVWPAHLFLHFPHSTSGIGA